jgi:hypothetical protein
MSTGCNITEFPELRDGQAGFENIQGPLTAPVFLKATNLSRLLALPDTPEDLVNG